MSHPPYPPQGGDQRGGDRSGAHGGEQPGSPDDLTRRLEAPPGGGQRDQTRQFDQGGQARQQYGEPGPPQYGQQAGQAPYGRTSGEPQYGPPQYGPPQYGQPQYGPPQYGPPQYGQPQYGQSEYGQPPPPPQYGQSPYGPHGQPPHAQPWGPPGGPGGQGPKKSSNTLVALVVAAVVVLAAAAAGLFFLLGDSDPASEAAATAAPPSTAEGPQPSQRAEPSPGSEGATQSPPEAGAIPPATVPPEGLGDDPAMDQLARGCYDGDMQACDDLYLQSERDSLYELYGGTCAGRQDVSESDTIYCITAFPEG